MFKKRMTFVIGAGASCELNLPSGDLLKDRIADLTAPTNDNPFGFRDPTFARDVAEHLRSNGSAIPEGAIPLKQAATVIRGALPWTPSIDNLLHNHQHDPAVVLLGKAAIARSILSAEAGSHFFHSGYNLNFLDGRSSPRPAPSISSEQLRNSWYGPFARILFAQVPWDGLREALSLISFVIFNYDRCLEQFLWMAIQEHYRVSETDAADALQHTKFVHPYGSLGPLEWQTEVSKGAVPLGGREHAYNAFTVSESLRTFTESVESDVGEKVKGAIGRAETIIFLGFGFLAQNLELIRSTNKAATRIFATTYGISEFDRGVVNSALRPLFYRTGTLTPRLEQGTCVDLFNNHYLSLTLQ